MPLTRRELCSAFPVALQPALLSVEDPSARQSTLPSTMYAFENLPVRTANNAQFRDVLKGRLATGESSATTLVKEISVSKAIENLEAAQQRDDTQPPKSPWKRRYPNRGEKSVNGKNVEAILST